MGADGNMLLRMGTQGGQMPLTIPFPSLTRPENMESTAIFEIFFDRDIKMS